MDESTRLRNRIAELESLVRELRGTCVLFGNAPSVNVSVHQVNLTPGGLKGTSVTGIRAKGGILALPNTPSEEEGTANLLLIKIPMAECLLSKSSLTPRPIGAPHTTSRLRPAHQYRTATSSQASHLRHYCLTIPTVAHLSNPTKTATGGRHCRTPLRRRRPPCHSTTTPTPHRHTQTAAAAMTQASLATTSSHNALPPIPPPSRNSAHAAPTQASSTPSSR